jgi:hypothetical protein
MLWRWWLWQGAWHGAVFIYHFMSSNSYFLGESIAVMACGMKLDAEQ